VVFEISIFAGACYSHQASFFNRYANAFRFTLYKRLYKNPLFHHNNETMSTAEISKILENFMHPNRVQ